VSFFGNVKKLFAKPTVQPLPEFPVILLDDIPAASAILFYGGNKLTELVGNRLYDYPFRPPAFHAAFYIGGVDHLFLNVGKFRTIQRIEDEFRSTRRVDIIIYKNIEPHIREHLASTATLDYSKPKVGLELPDYAFTDYLRFGLRFLKPSKKDFCSENVVELFASQNVKTSSRNAVDTAPWDLAAYAMGTPSAEIRTLFVGPDFRA